MTLTAVSKTQSPEAIDAILAAGQRVFGENRVQEGQGRWTDRKARLPDLELRLIGPLQTNKAAEALVQVNTGAEPQKAGVPADGVEALVAVARDLGLIVEGLMCIPPVDVDPQPHFDLLAGLARRNGLAVLSMGMSADYEVAIAHGATHVRVGSALFGERNVP